MSKSSVVKILVHVRVYLLLKQVWDMKTKKLLEDLPGHADEVKECI